MKKVLVTILVSIILLLSRLAAGQAAYGSLDYQLIQASKNGDAANVQQLLQRGANINAEDTGGYTALLMSAMYGKADVVKLLLDKGANIESRDKFQNLTPLLGAVRSSNTDTVKLLLDRGANIEAKGEPELVTPLLEAVSSGKTDIVKLLLDRRANIEAEDRMGSTALMLAFRKQNTDMVKLLLEKGANIEAKGEDFSFYDHTVLTIAARQGDVEMVKLLLGKGANIEAKDDLGLTPLMLAAYAGKVEVVTLLLEKGANVSAKSKDSHTAITLASEKGHSEVVKLLERGGGSLFADYLKDLQNYPNDNDRREKVIKLSTNLPTLPAIPEEARQLFLQASTLMKQSSSPKELAEPIELLNKALVIAPWWGDAYYNLSRALELRGWYDEAVRQLNYYLELKPSEANATEARAHIAVILSEKEAAARKKQEEVSLLVLKYVSGGITRLRYIDTYILWHGDVGIGDLYLYTLQEESPVYLNAFHMPNGHILAISLIAQSNNGMYAGDRIGVYDITDRSCAEGNDFAFGAQDYTTPCGGRYYVSVSNQPNATVTVTYQATGALITLPAALLYRGRALLGSNNWDACRDDGTVHQGGTKAMVLHFDCSVVKAAEDPTVNAAGLTPTTVKPE